MNLTVMNKCEKRFGFIKFDEMTRVKVLLLAVNSKRRKHLNSEDSEARFKVWYTFRTLSGDSGITVWSFEDRSSVPGPERWGLCNVKFHQNGDTVPLTPRRDAGDGLVMAAGRAETPHTAERRDSGG